MKHRLLYTLALLFATLQTFAQSTTTKYEYDALYRLSKVIYSNGVTVSYSYDELGNRTGKTVDKVGGETPPKGDVNDDQAVDVADIASIIDVMAKGGNNKTADVNGDGVVDVADIATIIDIMAGKGSAPNEKAYTSCPDEHHPHIIDLGLPSGTKWACCNVGASKPEEYGDYFAWGETQTKEAYNWETYIHCDGTEETCHNLGSDIAGTEHDAARVIWKAPWKMPTKEQYQELVDNCTSEWTTQNYVYGRKFTGPNGGTIFLPTAGNRWNSDYYNTVSMGCYWSSTLAGNHSRYAWSLIFGWGNLYVHELGRDYGNSVRPVR